MASLLVVEDDETIGSPLQPGFRSPGQHVSWARRLDDAAAVRPREAVRITTVRGHGCRLEQDA